MVRCIQKPDVQETVECSPVHVSPDGQIMILVTDVTSGAIWPGMINR